ncbi:unnamed protein product [Cylindrotheca closterium]|uniref:Cystatin domain-containing protein n=1 Tax=Cylindrotheca closterium TaxID=2856 RepID=A0AAD2G3S8_9STRA|nr:unnamed protein product [Cylindrotheca closterium]
MAAMAGGHSAPRAPSEEEKAFLTSPPIRKLVEGAIKTNGGSDLTISELDPVLMTTQVVAGTNYKVKYHIGDEKYVHAKIFEPLPCYADEQKPEVSHFEMNKSKKDKL